MLYIRTTAIGAETVMASILRLVESALTTAIKIQAAFKLEFRFQRPDGSLSWVIAQSNPEVDTTAAVIAFVGSITDISALKNRG